MLRAVFPTSPEGPDTSADRARLEAAIAAEEARQAEQAAITEEERQRLPTLLEQLAVIDRTEQQAEGSARVETLTRDMHSYQSLMAALQAKLSALTPDIAWLGELETRIRAERKSLVLDCQRLDIDGPRSFEPGDILAYSHMTLSRAWSRGVAQGERG